MKKVKKVRFKTHHDVIDDDHDDDSRNGIVRIRVVMTQEELKKMLRNNNKNNDDGDHNKNNTSLEELLSVVKLRGGRVYEVGHDDVDVDDEDGSMNPWRPSLESIPEDIATS
ncbi:hypothetical protein PIB30_045538 [Stylosanthes scabra]|uniref:Uncharacterized protein n=1 Tax=Stylosanthes scabra TaxID=79078 RepID=A0ABU6TGI1_9FABA|nr:hypothetical protein [Stylosanthes scabra]